MATTSKCKDKTGEMIEDTEWHRITFFGRLAEIVGEYVKKGRPIYIEGRIKTANTRTRMASRNTPATSSPPKCRCWAAAKVWVARLVTKAAVVATTRASTPPPRRPAPAPRQQAPAQPPPSRRAVSTTWTTIFRFESVFHCRNGGRLPGVCAPRSHAPRQFGAVDHAAAQAHLAVVQHRRLARRDGPLGLRKSQREGRIRRGWSGFERARRIGLPVARLGASAPAGGALAADPAGVGGVQRPYCSQGWSWPCTTHSVLLSMSLRATNQGAWSPPPRCGAFVPHAADAQALALAEGVEAQAHVLAQHAAAFVLDRARRCRRGSGSGTRGTAARR